MFYARESVLLIECSRHLSRATRWPSAVWRCCGMTGLTESMVSRACMLFPVFCVFVAWFLMRELRSFGRHQFRHAIPWFLCVRLVAVSRFFRSVTFE